MERPYFASVTAYGARFTDAAYWRPYVATICSRHGLLPCHRIRAGLPGTHPVFIVDGRYVVKLFTHRFNGARSFAVESDLYPLLAGTWGVPAPSLLARGHLFPEDGGWPWPYLVSALIPGRSLGEVRERVGLADQLALAAHLGPIVRQIHALPVTRVPSLTRSWGAYACLLDVRRASCADDYARGGGMPPPLLEGIAAYLPPTETLIDQSRQPCLLHGDLNEDHVLGRFERGRWQITGIIDFGDAQVGDPLYELVALHLGAFRCNKQLLRTFLGAYGSTDGQPEHFAAHMMRLTLLHEFTVLGRVFEEFPLARTVRSLAELATLLWDLGQPGLSDSNQTFA